MQCTCQPSPVMVWATKKHRQQSTVEPMANSAPCNVNYLLVVPHTCQPPPMMVRAKKQYKQQSTAEPVENSASCNANWLLIGSCICQPSPVMVCNIQQLTVGHAVIHKCVSLPAIHYFASHTTMWYGQNTSHQTVCVINTDTEGRYCNERMQQSASRNNLDPHRSRVYYATHFPTDSHILLHLV